MEIIREYERAIIEHDIKEPVFEIKETIGNINLLKNNETVYSSFLLKKEELMQIIKHFELI